MSNSNLVTIKKYFELIIEAMDIQNNIINSTLESYDEDIDSRIPLLDNMIKLIKKSDELLKYISQNLVLGDLEEEIQTVNKIIAKGVEQAIDANEILLAYILVKDNINPEVFKTNHEIIYDIIQQLIKKDEDELFEDAINKVKSSLSKFEECLKILINYIDKL